MLFKEELIVFVIFSLVKGLVEIQIGQWTTSCKRETYMYVNKMWASSMLPAGRLLASGLVYP